MSTVLGLRSACLVNIFPRSPARDSIVQRRGERQVHMYPSSQSRFPAQRAFVVQVAVAELGVPDVPLGRAEHVMSGTATHFASWAELGTFIERVLVEVEQHPP